RKTVPIVLAATFNEHPLSMQLRSTSLTTTPPKLWQINTVGRTPIPMVGSKSARFLALSWIVTRDDGAIKNAEAGWCHRRTLVVGKLCRSHSGHKSLFAFLQAPSALEDSP